MTISNLKSSFIVLGTLAVAGALAAPAGAVVPTEAQRVGIDEAQVRAHQIRPAHVVGVVTDKGREDMLNFVPPPPGPPAQPPQHHLDVAKFGPALHATLKDSVVGYAMQLRQHGTPVSTLIWNWAQTPSDHQEGWTLDRRQHVASVSKLMTAIGMTRTLDEHHISYDAKIVDYLPAYWAKGRNIDKITFRDLMTHTSGFDTGGSDSDFETMKSHVAQGVPGIGHYHYENMNYGLCRILMPIINGEVPKTFTFPTLPMFRDQLWDMVTVRDYDEYMQNHVFHPSGVQLATLDHPANAALAYTFPANGNGWDSGDLESMAGGAGWHMSVNELLDVMGTLRRKGTILPSGKAQEMIDDYFGIDVIQSTPAGKLYNKNGLWQDGSGHTEQALAYFLPEDMEMVVLVNSQVSHPAKFFRDVVTNVYLANIK